MIAAADRMGQSASATSRQSDRQTRRSQRVDIVRLRAERRSRIGNAVPKIAATQLGSRTRTTVIRINPSFDDDEASGAFQIGRTNGMIDSTEMVLDEKVVLIGDATHQRHIDRTAR